MSCITAARQKQIREEATAMNIHFFDSFDEMTEAERKARESADKRVQEWQRRMKKGDCFRQWTPYGFEIFGEVLGEYDQERLKNYRRCCCYSIACREGERGDVHVSTISADLDRGTFERIKRKLVEWAFR